MDQQRRVFLQYSIVAGISMVSLMNSSRLWATWPAPAFETSNIASVFKSLAGENGALESSRVVIEVPASVDNPAIVPVRVSTDLPDVRSLSILVEKNQYPLAAKFNISPAMKPLVSTRVRLEQAGNLIALVETVDGYFLNSAPVEITAFLCEVSTGKP